MIVKEGHSGGKSENYKWVEMKSLEKPSKFDLKVPTAMNLKQKTRSVFNKK